MDALEVIFNRRSVRKYKSDEVSDEQINILLKAAMLAPSAKNMQPWEFIVVKSQETRNAIANAHPNAAMVKDAPVAIVVCGDTQKEAFAGYWQQDCSAATQNILLSAHALGLGTVWTGVYPKPDRHESIRKMFNIPAHIIPLCVIAVGYANQDLPEVNRFDTSKIIYETY